MSGLGLYGHLLFLNIYFLSGITLYDQCDLYI